ncbi:CBS domain-containing protein [Skermanella mucosa]|uniref:CBS domain-containing protein n=1 Tax=Skermanella mucosa TaxID=1789672 RepID=UPI00192AD711|nr:CBS domain-containing protein [Skermanella mucosa]UEM21543.1 CBS domain-containing protein [Skermanella mucosa]
MPKRKLVPDVVREQEVISFKPDDMVGAAVKAMAERRVGAVLVMEGNGLKGIFTERDLVTRVVAQDLDPNTTPLHHVMTAGPDTLPPDAMAIEALDLMRRHNYRHLPVLRDGAVVGIVSIRDLYAAVHAQLEQEIKERDSFIFGQDYSIGA